MPSAAEFQAKVNKAVTNMDRLDAVVNGGPGLVVGTDNGEVPSLANLATRFSGWSPLLSPEADGDRRVLKVVDWFQSTPVDGAIKPPVGKYLGLTGLVDTAAAAADFGLPGPVGGRGPNGYSAATLAQLKAAEVTDGPLMYDGAVWSWETENAPYTADDQDIVESDNAPLSEGAWVRQSVGDLRVFALSDWTWDSISAQSPLSAISQIRTTGETVFGEGGWWYIRDPDQTDTAETQWRRRDAAGNWWKKLDRIIADFDAPQGGTADGAVYACDPRQTRLIMSAWDAAPQNDTNGYFAGVVDYLGRQPNPRDNALYSLVSGRNCYVINGGYGTAQGHDCLNVAVAAFVGGAGCVVGDPTDITGNLTSFSGYCSFLYGKNSEVLGQTAAGLGELIKSNSRAGLAATYQAQIEDTATLGALALGPYTTVRNGGGADDFMTNGVQFAIGGLITSDGIGKMSIGSGVNGGTRFVNDIVGSLQIGSGTSRGTVVFQKGTAGDAYQGAVYSRTGWRLMGDNGGTTNINFGGMLGVLDNSANGGRSVVRFQTRKDGVVGSVLDLRDDYLRPFTTNTVGLGDASRVFANLFVTNAPTVGSDKRLKEQEEPIPDAWLDAWGECEWLRYKLRQSVSEKGEAARWHLGLIAADPEDDTNARTVAAIFARHGIDGRSIGLLCYDKWDEQTEPVMKSVKIRSTSERMVNTKILSRKGIPLQKRVVDSHVHEELVPDGKKVRVVRPAGDQWSIRYEQALILEAAFQRRRADRIEARLSTLEQRLAALEAA